MADETLQLRMLCTVRQDLMSDGSEFQVCGAATENASQRVHVAFLDQTAVVDELELKVLSATYES